MRNKSTCKNISHYSFFLYIIINYTYISMSLSALYAVREHNNYKIEFAGQKQFKILIWNKNSRNIIVQYFKSNF